MLRYDEIESHHVLDVITDLAIDFITTLGSISHRELDIPGHVGTDKEIKQGAMLNTLDRVFR